MEMAKLVAVLRVEEKTSSSTRKSVTQHYQRFTFFFAQMLGNFQEKIRIKTVWNGDGETSDLDAVRFSTEWRNFGGVGRKTRRTDKSIFHLPLPFLFFVYFLPLAFLFFDVGYVKKKRKEKGPIRKTPLIYRAQLLTVEMDAKI